MALILECLARIRMLFGCGLCALVVYWLIWLLHSLDPWLPELVFSIVDLMCFSPLVVVAWSLLSRSSDSVKTYRLVRYTILLHIAAALILSIMGGNDWAWMGSAGILMDVILIGLGPWRTNDPAPLRFYRKGVLMISGAVAACLMTWSYLNIGLVIWQSAELAGDRAYCLQIPGSLGKYEEVENVFELNGLSMQSLEDDHGLHLTFHAVLVIQGDQEVEWYNWSYRQVRFTPISKGTVQNPVLGMSEPFCKPQPHFVRNLLPNWPREK